MRSSGEGVNNDQHRSKDGGRTLVDRLGNDGVATVCSPGNEDLSGSSAELVGNLLDLGVVDDLGLASH